MWAHGCAEAEGCLGGDDGVCVPPSPCQALAFACDDPMLELFVVRGESDRPPGLDALAARGDVLLGNSRMRAVIDAIGSPHHLAPTGGTLIDLVPRDPIRGVGYDELNQVFQAVGILPDDEAHYDKLELLDQSPELVAVIARGHLYGDRDVDIVTRYEARPCEPGIRIRTEIYHGDRDPQSFLLSDAYWWGDRSVTPFVPLQGQGFLLPDLDLLELGDSIFDIPFMAAQGHQPGAAAYGTVRCDEPSAEAFQSQVVSALGRARTVVLTGDSLRFERFITVAHGPGLSRAVDHCRTARSMLFDEPSAVVRGRVMASNGGPVGGDERVVSLLFYRPAEEGDADAPAGRTPHSEVVPDGDGSFSLMLDPDTTYRVQPHVLGRPLPVAVELYTGAPETVLDPIRIPPAGVVDVVVTDSSGSPVIADVILTPAPPTRAQDVTGSIHGVFHEPHCAPYLGPPHGGSPACNRALTSSDGRASFAAPEGTFWVYASRGPFATLARQLIEVENQRRVSMTLRVDRLANLVPGGVLSADFHVHAGASFDSSLPEVDRALSFVSTGVDVLAATDHDVVTSYAEAIDELGIGDEVIVMPGVETTGQFLFLRPPDSEFPQVIGHYNFWPLHIDHNRPRNGGPDDELLEPGALFDRIETSFDGTGVRQLNHPFAESKFGRDNGYLTAIGYDPRVVVPSAPDNTAEGQLPRRPGGGRRNMDHDVQEVMNGAATLNFLQYRAGWHSFLSQGILKGGTANSDSHTLAVEVLGFPRTLVFGGHAHASFDRERFNADVRNGRMVGTNGPVLVVCAEGADGNCHEPSLSSFVPASGGALRIEVRAAPWIGIEEVRVIVNGALVRTITQGVTTAADPFGNEAVTLYRGSLPLDELLANVTGDAWIVVEAGYPLWPAGDVNDDGLVETTDNNADGIIDGHDQDGLEEEDYYAEPPVPTEGDPRFHLHIVAPGTWPTSFANPLLTDRAGDGWQAPGL